MEDEFAGKSREDYLTTVVVMWEMLRELFSRLPIIVGLPELQVDDPASIEDACNAVQRARDELLEPQFLPATLEALIAEGALEMIQALMMVRHTDVFGFTDWHAELWYRSLERAQFMCRQATTQVKRHTQQEPPKQE
ncbi:hypothetical protein ACQEU6_08440 [Spirillospora sp. CA-108201]